MARPWSEKCTTSRYCRSVKFRIWMSPASGRLRSIWLTRVWKASLPFDESRVDRELAAFEPFIEQEIAEVGRCLALRLGVGRQVEHYEDPHQTIPGKNGGMGSHEPSPASVSVSGGRGRASARRPVSKLWPSDVESLTSATETGLNPPPSGRSAAISSVSACLA